MINQQKTEKQINQFCNIQPLIVTNNKMVRKCLKTLMHRLLHQYRSQTYDSNCILSSYYLQLQQFSANKMLKEGLQIKVQIKQEMQQSQRVSNINQYSIVYWDHKEYLQLIKLWPEISVFIWEMARSPKWYVEMLKNQEIYAQQNECIDMHVFTTKIYKKVTNQANKMTPYVKQFQQICADQIYFFLQEVSLQICGCFKSGQKIVVTQLNVVTSVVQKSEIITFFLLFKIFKDTSTICKRRIVHQLQEGIFRNIQVDVVQSFALYIIEKYEVLDMQMDHEKKTEQKISITDKIMNANHVRWRQAIRQDGEIGILVQLIDDQSQGRSTNYMLMFDENGEVSVVNSNSLHKQWKVCKKAEENYDLVNLVKSKKALVQKMRTSTTAPVQMTLLENVGVVGGSMGKCLAQIDMYDNVGDFMVSLSKRTIIGGSFNYLLMSVPLLGYVFMTGGFTYTFYYIFSNQYADNDKKLRELRNVTLGSATAIGSGLIGATVGQALIPVPVLGAFIGGLVGGFLGQFGSRAINNVIQTARFKQLIEQMKNTIQPKGFWHVTDRTLKILEINRQKFYETIPQNLEHKMNCDKIWITLIFFTLICFDQSKKRLKFTQQKMKKQKRLKKKLSDFEIIQANQQMNASKQYQPSLDFMCIMHYFDDNHIFFIEYHEDVAFLLTKIFAKLK